MSKIKIKDSYDEMTVEDFIAIREVLKSDSIVDKKFHIISILSDLEYEGVRELPVSVVAEVSKLLSFLEEPVDANDLRDTQVINNIEYKVTKDIPNMETGRYIDLMYFLDQNKEDHYMNLHQLLAVIMSPWGKSYDKYENKDHQENMLQMPIKDALAIAVFFYQIYRASTNVIQDYSNQTKSQTGSEKVGVGIAP